MYGDSNSIIGNSIFDSSATSTNVAIEINNAASSSNYLADNTFSSTPGTSTIADTGTGTVYANQSRAENGGQLTNRTANNATAFQIQNASGANILTADTSAGEIELGSASLAGKLVISDGSSNTVTLAIGAMSSNYTLTLPSAVGASGDCLKTSDASGTLAFSSCGGVNTETVGFVPEYQGAVIQGDGTNNSGTMYSGFVNGLSNAQGVYHNYYEWYTAQSTSQDYDIIVVN